MKVIYAAKTNKNASGSSIFTNCFRFNGVFQQLTDIRYYFSEKVFANDPNTFYRSWISKFIVVKTKCSNEWEHHVIPKKAGSFMSEFHTSTNQITHYKRAPVTLKARRNAKIITRKTRTLKKCENPTSGNKFDEIKSLIRIKGA